MNMVREFLSFFASVMVGRRDPLSAFLEPLTMGEQYLRWGMESRDMRDFRSAMDHLHLCHDQDAPMASLLIRKYSCISEVTAAAVDTLLMRHRKVIDEAVKTETSFRDELETMSRKIQEGKNYIRKLQEEGSLIKARAEESRVQEITATSQRLRDMLESGEGRTEIYASYDRIHMEATRFFRELDHASSMVLASPILEPANAEALASQMRNRLESLQALLERASPVTAPKDGGQEADG